MCQFININSIHTNLDLGSHQLTKFIKYRIENLLKTHQLLPCKDKSCKIGNQCYCISRETSAINKSFQLSHQSEGVIIVPKNSKTTERMSFPQKRLINFVVSQNTIELRKKLSGQTVIAPLFMHVSCELHQQVPL